MLENTYQKTKLKAVKAKMLISKNLLEYHLISLNAFLHNRFSYVLGQWIF